MPPGFAESHAAAMQYSIQNLGELRTNTRGYEYIILIVRVYKQHDLLNSSK